MNPASTDLWQLTGLVVPLRQPDTIQLPSQNVAWKGFIKGFTRDAWGFYPGVGFGLSPPVAPLCLFYFREFFFKQDRAKGALTVKGLVGNFAVAWGQRFVQAL